MGLAVLVVNAGSSSLKLRLIGADDELLGARDLPPQPEDLAAELTALGAPDAVGHRIVHGGQRFREPVLIDTNVEAALRELRPPSVEVFPLSSAREAFARSLERGRQGKVVLAV